MICLSNVFYALIFFYFFTTYKISLILKKEMEEIKEGNNFIYYFTKLFSQLNDTSLFDCFVLLSFVQWPVSYFYDYLSVSSKWMSLSLTSWQMAEKCYDRRTVNSYLNTKLRGFHYFQKINPWNIYFYWTENK